MIIQCESHSHIWWFMVYMHHLCNLTDVYVHAYIVPLGVFSVIVGS